MEHITPTAIFVFITLLVGYFFGAHMENSSPDGIWLYTPPADGSGEPASSFRVGASIGTFLASISLASIGVSMFTWAKLSDKKLHRLCMPLFLSAAIGLFSAIAFGTIA